MQELHNMAEIPPDALEKFIFFERDEGFADRFIRLRRAVQAGQKLHLPVFAYWVVNHHCKDHFLRFFEAIPQVTFVGEPVAESLRNHHGRVAEAAVLEHSVRWPPLEECFPMLRLKPEYIAKVNAFVVRHKIEDAIGFHIRKGDNVTRKGVEKGIVFQYQLFDEVAAQNSKDIFLATDNKQVRDEFVAKYPGRIHVQEAQFNTTELRQTPLEAAILDLYILAHCAEFHGTRGENGNLVTAFSRMAKFMNMARRKGVLPGFVKQQSPAGKFFSLFRRSR